MAGRFPTLTPPDPQLKGARYPRRFQTSHLSSENPVSKFAFKWGSLHRYGVVREVLRRAEQDDRAAAAAAAASRGVLAAGGLNPGPGGMSSLRGSGGSVHSGGGGGGGSGGGGGGGFGGFGGFGGAPPSPLESLGGSSSELYDLSPMSENRSALKSAAAQGYRAEQQQQQRSSMLSSSRQRTPDASDGGVSGGSGVGAAPMPSVSSPQRAARNWQPPQQPGYGGGGSGGGSGGALHVESS
jgi:hypothetical protein